MTKEERRQLLWLRTYYHVMTMLAPLSGVDTTHKTSIAIDVATRIAGMYKP